MLGALGQIPLYLSFGALAGVLAGYGSAAYCGIDRARRIDMGLWRLYKGFLVLAVFYCIAARLIGTVPDLFETLVLWAVVLVAVLWLYLAGMQAWQLLHDKTEVGE